MFDFYLFQVKEERIKDALIGYKPKRGFVKIEFLDCRHDNGKPDVEVYDLRGSAMSDRQFKNWVKREFGYLRTEVTFG